MGKKHRKHKGDRKRKHVDIEEKKTFEENLRNTQHGRKPKRTRSEAQQKQLQEKRRRKKKQKKERNKEKKESLKKQEHTKRRITVDLNFTGMRASTPGSPENAKKAFDSEASDSDENGVSVANIRKDLGFSMPVEFSDHDSVADLEAASQEARNRGSLGTASASLELIKTSLKPDVTCALCLELLINPISGSCGHSFCRACICVAIHKMSDDFSRFKCPQCRKLLCVKCLKRFQVNLALKSTLAAVFPDGYTSKELEKEKRRFKKALRDINGGTDDTDRGINNLNLNEAFEGNNSIIRVEEFDISKGISVRRTIVKDKDDFVMRLCLGLGINSNLKALRNFHFFMMQLEEDEDDQPLFSGQRKHNYLRTGFPAVVKENGDNVNSIVKRGYNDDICVKLLSGGKTDDVTFSSMLDGRVDICSSRSLQEMENETPFSIQFSSKAQPTLLYEIIYNMDEVKVAGEIKIFSKSMKPLVQQRSSSSATNSDSDEGIEHDIDLADTTDNDEESIVNVESDDDNDDMNGFIASDNASIEMDTDYESLPSPVKKKRRVGKLRKPITIIDSDSSDSGWIF